MYTKEDIHVERIEPDLSFLDENLAKVKTLFENSILLELLGCGGFHAQQRILIPFQDLQTIFQMTQITATVKKENMEKWLDVITVTATSNGFTWIV